MRKETVNGAFFFIVLAVLLVLSFLILVPILDFMLLGFLLAIGFWPVRQAFRRVVRSDGWAAFLTLLLAGVLVVLPMVAVALSLLDEAQAFAAELEPDDLEGSLRTALHLPADGFGAAVGDFVIPKMIGFLGALTQDLAEILARMVIGLMVLAFVMFYAFAEGPQMVARLQAMLPLKRVYTERLVHETASAVHAVFFGQILVSIVQGVVLALGFWLFGVPNALLWGFVSIVVSILPAVGPPTIYIPGAVYAYFFVGAFEAVALLIWGAVLCTIVIEHWWKLRVIGRMGQIHPLVVLVGVVGGIGMFGLSGFIFGPLILALLIVFARVFSESYAEDPNYVFL